MVDSEHSAYLDAKAIDWNAVRSATFEVRQSLRYQYPGPIEDLRQVLVLIPPDRIDGQRLLAHELSVIPEARPRYSLDSFGNRICQITLPRVDGVLQFDLKLRVERRRSLGVPPSSPAEVRVYTLPSPLTEPSPALRQIAAELAEAAASPALLAARINEWVYERLSYRSGATDIRTTAADALDLGAGVCQDYAHLMIALCRLAGLPARYVSGHLLGEGAMHAWTQVLLPREVFPTDVLPTELLPTEVLPREDSVGTNQLWQAFDPTHGRRVGLSYISIAVGRDYGDVSPTRGSFRAPYSGYLAGSEKRAGVLAVA